MPDKDTVTVKLRRVRMIHTEDSFGTVTNENAPPGADGQPRVTILWDRTKKETDWNPGFLMPADSKEADDPDEVRFGNAGSRRGRTYVDQFDCFVIVPGGVFRT